MIQPYRDFTGRMSNIAVTSRNQQAMIEAVNKAQDSFKVLESMQIAATGSVTYTLSNPITADTTLATIPHNLGYTPLFAAFFTVPLDNLGNLAYSPLPYFSTGAEGGAISTNPIFRKTAFRITASADTVNLYIKMKLGFATAVYLPSGFQGFPFKYYIFTQPNS